MGNPFAVNVGESTEDLPYDGPDHDLFDGVISQDKGVKVSAGREVGEYVSAGPLVEWSHQCGGPGYACTLFAGSRMRL